MSAAHTPSPATDERLLAFAETEHQRAAIEAVIAHGGIRAAARALGKNYTAVHQSVQQVKQKAAASGYAPDAGLAKPVADGFTLKGYTLGEHANGGTTVWYKASADRQAQWEALKEAVESLKEEIPHAPAVEPPAQTNAELLNCYVLTDYHLGALGWPEETRDGAWDTATAEETLYKWLAYAIAHSPDAERAVLAQLGDFLHHDGLDAVTPEHHNLLDADTRFQKMVRVCIRALRRVVADLLAKHNEVTVIMAEGNHDPASSIWLRECFAALYTDEPRVTVDTSPDAYYCVEHGTTSLFFHHGHLEKMADVDSVFAGKFRDVFGRTRHSYAHLGHLHNQQVKETNLMIVERHPTLAAKDAYASRHGYLSQRAAPVITYHRTAGCVGRTTITPEIL